MSQETDPRKVEAKRRLLAGETIVSIAAHLNVNRKTIERWADEGGWRELKQAEKVVVSFERPTPRQDEPVKVRARRQRGDIDELEIIELAISDLSATLGSGETDSRSLGGIAGALVRLLEYRRKICPPTAAELAEQILALGITPNELVAELKARWQPQQRA